MKAGGLEAKDVKALIKNGQAVYVRLHGPFCAPECLLLALPTAVCETCVQLTPVVTSAGVDVVCGLGRLMLPLAQCVWHPPGSPAGGMRGELAYSHAESPEKKEGA